MKSIIAGFAAAGLLAGGAAAADKIDWPNGAKAALALTYDDSLDSQLDNAIPALDRHGIKGTFFLTIERIETAAEAERWREAAANGHELGNHTLFHPCQASPPDRDWVEPAADLDLYDIPRLVRELETANRALAALDGRDGPRTFAYPCADYTAGGENFVDAIAPLFLASRYTSEVRDWISDPPVDVKRVATFGPPEVEASVFIHYAEQLIERGGVGTITFHGIGGDYLTVSTEAHDELVAWLANNQDRLWIDTFQNIMTYVIDQQGEQAGD